MQHGLGRFNKSALGRLKPILLLLGILCLCQASQANLLSETPSGHPEAGIPIECVTIERGEIQCNGTIYTNAAEETDEVGSPSFFFHLFGVIFFVLFAGLMSGLTLGLLSLDVLTLEILIKSGTPTQRKHAIRIMPLVKRHHLLLVTLLLCNAASMECLPLFLEKLVDPVLAIIISVTAVLFFGEVFPQAICSRYGLAIGSYLSYMVWFLIGLCFIVSYPVGKLLDWMLGVSHGTFFRRAELKELISFHERGKSKQTEEPLDADEVKIITGALELKNKTARHAMIPLDQVFMLSIEDRLDQKSFEAILSKGRSRVPLYKDGDRKMIVGYILVKNLVNMDPTLETPIRNLNIRRLPNVAAETNLFRMLKHFKKGQSHMAIVVDDKDLTPVGILTLEDVMEELLQEEIIDETDLLVSSSSNIPKPSPLNTNITLPMPGSSNNTSLNNSLSGSGSDIIVEIDSKGKHIEKRSLLNNMK
jgi:ankyrin repeat/SOCS box protein 13/metal transporter CNNM